jgi:hypothetical protein
MEHATTESLSLPPTTPRDALSSILHEGARRMLIDAIEAEVAEYLAGRADQTDAAGRRLVVRNGHLPEPALQSAEKRWRALNGSSLIPEVISGVRFVDGVKQQAA